MDPSWVANLRYDLPAGLVVFLVALPLCLGIALASDAPLMSGVVAGVVGGTVIAALSGSALSVSGPAAGLAVIVAEGVHTLGAFEAVAMAVVLAGLIQLAMGLARMGFVASLFPHSVIKGMLAAIGIILILKQIPHALGRDQDYEGDLDFWLAGGDNTFTEILHAMASASPGVVVVTLVSLAILVAWESSWIKGQAWSTLVPGALVAVVSSVLINEAYGLWLPGWHIQATDGHMVEIPVLSSVDDLLTVLPLPDWSRATDPGVLKLAVVLAIIASIETLLSVEAVDRLDPFRRLSPMNRELAAQGVGNTLSGLVGGLPITAVIVRSSANVYSGGRTRVSAIVHGILLIVLVLSVPLLLNRVPLAALAAVLLVVGYKLARISLFREMWVRGLDQFIPFVVTVIVTVVSDLLTGVAVGVAVGGLMVLATNHHSAIAVVHDDGDWLVKFLKDVSFVNKARLRKVLTSIPNGSRVIIDGSRAAFIDHDIRETVEDFVQSAPQRDLHVELMHCEPRPFPLRLPGA
ncbi:MAG: SulP family inorganic anion transporter [Alphaproteobacteria bacterium]|nr:SulP family inorganic anion transporter [Alphaproteobacteria bacterium]